MSTREKERKRERENKRWIERELQQDNDNIRYLSWDDTCDKDNFCKLLIGKFNAWDNFKLSVAFMGYVCISWTSLCMTFLLKFLVESKQDKADIW